MSLRSFALHCRWVLRALDRNPLIRASDRVEALTMITLVAMTLLAIPVAAHVADQAYNSTMVLVAEQSQSRHSLQAVAIDPSTAIQGGARLPASRDTPQHVRAQWREGTTERTEQVVSRGAVLKGAHLTVWLDRTGKVVAAPLTATEASVNASSAGWSAWTLIAIVCGLVGLVIRKALDVSRAHAWDRALGLLSLGNPRPGEDGWANRRP